MKVLLIKKKVSRKNNYQGKEKLCLPQVILIQKARKNKNSDKIKQIITNEAALTESL